MKEVINEYSDKDNILADNLLRNIDLPDIRQIGQNDFIFYRLADDKADNYEEFDLLIEKLNHLQKLLLLVKNKGLQSISDFNIQNYFACYYQIPKKMIGLKNGDKLKFLVLEVEHLKIYQTVVPKNYFESDISTEDRIKFRLIQ